MLFDSRHLIKPIDEIIINSLTEIQNKEINFIFTKNDKIKSIQEKEKMNQSISDISKKFNKNIFRTSIKESNDIISLRKFLFKSQEN